MAYGMETLKKMSGAVKGAMKTNAKWVGIGAAAAAGIYATGRLVGAIRDSREYQEPERMPEPAMPEAYMMDGPQTMMGQVPVEGAHAQRVLAGRGQGAAAGVDATSPQMEQDGRSTVDGRPVQDLGGIGM